MVAFRFQRDLDREERGAVAPDPRGLAERYRFWRSSWIVPGFVLGDRRTVLISDPWISRGAIESITVRTRSGAELPGRLEAFLGDVGGAIVKTGSDLPVEPLSFEGASTTSPPRYAASVTEGDGADTAWVEDLGAMRNGPWSSRPGAFGFGTPESPFGGLDPNEEAGARTIDLVCDVSARPLGFRFGSTIDAAGRWRGPRVLASRRVSLDALRALEDARPSPLHRLTVTFRTLSRHDRDRDPFRFGGRGTAEEEYWGLAITPDLAPGARAAGGGEGAARPLDPPGRRRGRGRGGLVRRQGRGLRGLRRARGGRRAGRRCPPRRRRLPRRTAPCSCTGRRSVAARAATRSSTTASSVGSAGYGDRSFLATERAVGTGALLRDLDGRVLGFSTRLDPVDKERRLSTGSRSGRSSTTYPVVAVLFDEVGFPATLAEDLDTRVMPQEETAARRLPWLGVETDGLDEGLAEAARTCPVRRATADAASW